MGMTNQANRLLIALTPIQAPKSDSHGDIFNDPKARPGSFLHKLQHGVLLVAALLMASLVTVSFSTSDASAQGAVRSKHGDWEIRCDTPPGAPSSNAL